jgi:hypothetical protein
VSRCWCLVVRGSTFDVNIALSAIRFRKRVYFANVTGRVTNDKKQRRITNLNHKLSRLLITFTDQFENPPFRSKTSKESVRIVRGQTLTRGTSANSSNSQHRNPNVLVFASTFSTRTTPANDVRRVARSEPVMATNFYLRSIVGRHAELNASENIAQLW